MRQRRRLDSPGPRASEVPGLFHAVLRGPGDDAGGAVVFLSRGGS